MKNFIGYAIAGMIGAAVVIGVDNWSNPQDSTYHLTGYNETISEVPAVKVNTTERSSTAIGEFPTSFNKAAKTATPAVVKINTIQGSEPQTLYSDNPFRYFFGERDMYGPRMGSGSGVIISSNGYIVTNNHVVAKATILEVTLDDRRTYKAELIGVDDRTDLAVIKIEAYDLPTLEYADSDDIEIGDWVLAIGNPFEYLTSTVTAGIVSAKGRDINILRSMENIESFIQTDAAVNPGNSGGALVNLEGKLVGINTAIASQTGTFSGYSFAIPVNLMKKIAEDIIQYGTYKRAILGVGIQPIDGETAHNKGIEVQPGVYVNTVMPGGAAELAGVLPNDIITAVDGREVKSVPQIQEFIGGKQVGDVIELQIRRGDERKEIAVRLKE